MLRDVVEIVAVGERPVVELALERLRAVGRRPAVRVVGLLLDADPRPQREHQELGVERLERAHARFGRGARNRLEPLVRGGDVHLVAAPRVEIERRDALLGRRVLEHPRRVGEPDRLDREAELRGRQLRDQCLRRRRESEESAALGERRLAHGRHLRRDRQRGERPLRRLRVAARERDQLVRGFGARRAVHRAARVATAAIAMLPAVIRLDQIRRSLAAHSAVVLPRDLVRRAAVAMVLADGKAGPEVLFIERARALGDPWSGHMAFPGGRVEPADPSGRAAAERETLEEVGLSLAGAELLGRLDDKKGNPRTHPELVISAFVYLARTPGELAINSEVQDAFWFPLDGLLDRARHVQYTAHGEFEFPGILVGEPDRHVVWGLTYGFLESFFSVLGSPLPDRWTEEMRSFARKLEA